MRRLMWAALMASLVLAGCDGDQTTDPTAPTGPSMTPVETATATPTPTPVATTPPTSAPTPSPTATVPDDLSTIADDGEVTLAEAQAILDIQTDIYNAAVIALLTRPEGVTGGIDQGFIVEMGRIYDENMTDTYAKVWANEAIAGFEALNTDDPSGQTMTATSIDEARPDCIAIKATRDTSGLTAADEADLQDFEIDLVPGNGDVASNPSGWKRSHEAFELEDRQPCQN